MKYSVLMSVWKKDAPEFLRLALESIYEKQTRKPDELVVIFDGPLPQSLLDVLNTFAADKPDIVTYLPQEENRGLGAALHIAAAHCTGDFIFRMDADDISAPERFAEQIAYLEAHPETDVLGTATAEFETDPADASRICSFPETHEGIVKLAKSRNPINHMSVCIRREALTRVGSYQPMMLMEDYYLWLRMIADGCHFANLQKPLVYVRTGNGFYNRRSASTQIQSWRKMQDFMVEHRMIGRFTRMKNMLVVHVFVRIPPSLKKWVYSVFMRKKRK